MKSKKHVMVYSVSEYFALPKSERQRYGIYIKPYALPMSLMDDTIEGWNAFSKQIRQEYPVQGFIREWLFTYDNPVYRWFGRNYQRINRLKWNIKRFISPCDPRFRKAYKRWEYKDTCNLIVDVNFALILDFYYEEVVDGHVNWHSDDKHKKFYEWLLSAVNWIETHRAKLYADIDALYSTHDYKKIDKLEEMITATDKEYLKDMIDYKEYFWT